MARDINRRAGSQYLSISDDADEAHRDGCCDAIRCLTQAITITTTVVLDKSPAPNDDTATAVGVKEYLLIRIPSNRLKLLTGTIEPNTKAVICSYVRHRIL